jgi:hypothetical protein
VSRIELEACDSSGTQSVTFALNRLGPPVGGAAGPVDSLTALGTTGGTPGCGFFSVALTTPEPIDNEANTYFVFLNVNNELSISAVRVYPIRIETTAAVVSIQCSRSPVCASGVRGIWGMLRDGWTGASATTTEGLPRGRWACAGESPTRYSRAASDGGGFSGCVTMAQGAG